MVVSKSSWHYRLYAWTKAFWSKFDDKSFNQLPDLCSYISTILLQFPLTAVLWLAMISIEAIVTSFVKAVRYCFQSPKRSAISILLIVITLTFAVVALGVSGGVLFKDAMFEALKVWGLILGTTIIGAIALLLFIFGFLPWIFSKASPGGASFVQLTKTWVNDGAGKRFCRTLTFVD